MIPQFSYRSNRSRDIYDKPRGPIGKVAIPQMPMEKVLPKVPIKPEESEMKSPFMPPIGKGLPQVPTLGLPMEKRGFNQMPFGGFRAEGGRVKPGRRYRVGENGEEEIVLDQPGTVISDPIHRNAGAMEKYGQDSPTGELPTPRVPIPEEITRAPEIAYSQPKGITSRQQLTTPSYNDDIRMTEMREEDQPQPPAPPTKLDYLQGEYDKALNKPVEKQGVGQQALWWALQGIKKFANPNDQEPVQWLGQAKKEYDVQQKYNALAPELKKREDENARQISAAERIKKIAEARQAQNPILGKQLEGDYVTPDMAELGQQAGYGAVVPIDRRTRTMQERNGDLYASPTSGQPNFQKTNAPTKLQEKPIQRYLSDGTPVFTTGNKEIDREISENYRQADLNMEEQKYNTESERISQENEQARLQQESEGTEQSKALFNQGSAKEREAIDARKRADQLTEKADSIRDIDPSGAASLDKEANNEIRRASELETEAVSLKGKANVELTKAGRKAKPGRGKITSPKLGRGRTIPRSVVQSMLKSSKTYKSEADLIAALKRRGYRVD